MLVDHTVDTPFRVLARADDFTLMSRDRASSASSPPHSYVIRERVVGSRDPPEHGRLRATRCRRVGPVHFRLYRVLRHACDPVILSHYVRHARRGLDIILCHPHLGR